MSPEQVLAAVDQGVGVPGARVMRFRRTGVVLTMMGQGILGVGILAFIGLIRNHVRRPVDSVAYGAACVAILMAASALWLAFGHFRSLRAAESNVLIVLPTGVLRRLRNSVRFWSFEEFPSITFVRRYRRGVRSFTIEAGDPGPGEGPGWSDSEFAGSVREIYLNKRDDRFGETLVDDGSFGSPASVLSELLPTRRRFQQERSMAPPFERR